ncbi:probable protein phosphatase 2C BIPP2C1 [Coccomyxa sp. Obi]|nr:probable protein phosphatase 2C BIPP2C1 [Coccomyxa sp. Obi]
MHFRGLANIKCFSDCSISGAPGSSPRFVSGGQALSRLSTLVGATRVLQKAPLFRLGVLGALAAGNLRVQAQARASPARQSFPTVLAASDEGTASESAAERADSALDAESSGSAAERRETSSKDNGSTSLATASQLRLDIAAALMPHPEKVARGGEDAVFLADDRLAFGVADGVGSWMEAGVDPGIYARELMNKCKEAATRIPPSKSAPLNILTNAYYDTNKIGSCTACVVVLEGNMLHAANLGDSGFMVIRGDEVVYKSRAQQHSFNYPFQLGRGGPGVFDPPTVANCTSVPVRAGDILVAATDGVWDNVFVQDCAALVASASHQGASPAQAAESLARHAHSRAADPIYVSPFSLGARALGHQDVGGKMDDICVVIAYVVPAAKL